MKAQAIANKYFMCMHIQTKQYFFSQKNNITTYYNLATQSFFRLCSPKTQSLYSHNIFKTIEFWG